MTALVKIRQRRIGTGSSMERLLRCASSLALPHAYYETEATERGSVIHDYLAAVPDVGADAALELVPDEWREAVGMINLEGLDLQLALSPEVALAYDCETDTARELGRGSDGQGIYDDVRDSEIPERMDMIGVKAVPAGRRGLVVSWKTGWYTRKKKVADDFQLKIEGLAAARAFDLDVVEVQLINISEGPPYVQRETYSAMDIDRISIEVREYYERAKVVRDGYLRGELPDKFNMGEWCTYCPARRFCPAQVGAARAVISGDVTAELMQVSPIPPEMISYVWNRLKAVKKDVAVLEGMVRSAASAALQAGGAPIYLGDTTDGKTRWLARTLKPGNEVVDGNVAFEVIADARDVLARATDAKNRPLLTEEQIQKIDGERLACEATTVETSKKLITEAVMAVVPKGKGARAVEALLEEMRTRNGISRTPTDKVDEIIVKDANPPRSLASGPTDDASVEEAAAKHRARHSGDGESPRGEHDDCDVNKADAYAERDVPSR